MATRINYLHPFGTVEINAFIQASLEPYINPSTQLVFTSAPAQGEPGDPYFSESLVVKEIEKAAESGFDAVIVGCCFDPGVRVARAKVDIPVVGALEASLQFAPFYGRDFALVTDYHQAAAFMVDLVRINGTSRCREITAIDIRTDEMLGDPYNAGRVAVELAEKMITESAIESVVVACTTTGACVEFWLRDNPSQRKLSIVNPNVTALQTAEALVALARNGAYSISRRGYYGDINTLPKTRYMIVD